MIVLNILGYFGRNKQNSYAALLSRYDLDMMLKENSLAVRSFVDLY